MLSGLPRAIVLLAAHVSTALWSYLVPQTGVVSIFGLCHSDHIIHFLRLALQLSVSLPNLHTHTMSCVEPDAHQHQTERTQGPRCKA